MIHTIKRIIPLLLVLSLSGCFKDEGNYDYAELNAPTWLFDADRSPIYITTVIGEPAKATALFRFDKDSVETLKHVRYEWRYKDVLLSEDRNFLMPSEELLELLNEPSNKTNEGVTGTFAIIDTRTGIKHMTGTHISVKPKFDLRDWLILSENAGNSKLSFFKRKVINKETTYTLHDNMFESVNNTPLMGAPRNLRYSQAKAISAAVGATSVITSQGVYTVNNETFELVSEIKDEFLDGLPANFKMSNIFHSRLVSYAATEDGRLFRRVLSENQLGGKFISEPYTIDNKGYKITDFGIGKTRQWAQIAPVYDELNRRVMTISLNAPYAIKPVVILGGVESETPISGMPEGTEVLYFGAAAFEYIDYEHNLYTMVYNDKDGNTFIADFVIDYTSNTYVNHSANGNRPFPGGNIKSDAKFLGTANDFRGKESHLFYTQGNELRYIDRRTKEDNSYMRFDSKITAIKYAAADGYKAIGLGFENGDFLLLNVSAVESPKIIENSKVNVGGKIAEIMEYRNDFDVDAY